MSGHQSSRERGRDRGFGAPRFGGSRGGRPSGKKFGNPGEKLLHKKWNLEELPTFEKNFNQEHLIWGIFSPACLSLSLLYLSH
uniref:Uncharacterized protein n=1 Tax=Monodelphis domestica TaxID=13616 RepID=A0A5F8H3C8_MONDO